MSQRGWELLKRGLHFRGIWQGYLVGKCLLPLSLGISSWSGQMGIAVFQLSFIYSIRLLARKSLLTSGLNYSKRRKVRWELHMIVNYANNLLANLIISILDKYSLLFSYNVHLAFHFSLSCSMFFLTVPSPINTMQNAIQFTYTVMFIPVYSIPWSVNSIRARNFVCSAHLSIKYSVFIIELGTHNQRSKSMCWISLIKDYVLQSQYFKYYQFFTLSLCMGWILPPT